MISTTYDSIKKYKLLVAGWVLACVWVLFHGERVIVFGFLIYVALKYLNQATKRNENLFKMLLKGKRKWIVVAGMAVVVLGVWLQYSRMGIVGGFSIGGIFAQGTASDVVYIFNCAVDMWKEGKALHGYTLWHYLTCWIPGWSTDLLAATVIAQYYHTVGGGLFFTEPMMNFGIAGVLPYTAVFLCFICFVLRKPNEYMAIFWSPFVITIFRMTWYTGLDGWTFMSLYMTPLLYWFIRKVR